MTDQDIEDATRAVLAEFPQGKAFLTGSVLVAKEEAADLDFVVRGWLSDAERASRSGWHPCTHENYGDTLRAGWVALRKDKANVIVVFDDEHYKRWQRATHALQLLAQAGCVLNKEQRAALFTAVRGEFA